MKRRRIALHAFRAMAAGTLLLIASSGPAGATTLKRMDLPEMVGRADRVVHARAVDQNVYWNEAGTKIFTDTVFEVLDEAKGRGPKRLTVILLGGRLGLADMRADGTPQFRPGEEAILFTSPRPDGKKNLVGFSQGALGVVVDEATGEAFAVAEVPSGVTFVEEQGGRPVAVPGRAMRAPLDRFMDEIRALAEAGGTGKGQVRMRPERPKAASQGGNER